MIIQLTDTTDYHLRNVPSKWHMQNSTNFDTVLDKYCPFIPHMSIQEASRLNICDDIDHRDVFGQYAFATIIKKVGTKLRIHYDGYDSEWNVWSDYIKELHRFAIAGSISARKAHLYKHKDE